MIKKILLILLLVLPVNAQYVGSKPIKGSAQLNKNHPAVRNLVGCWLMNEGGGDTVYDLSGYGNDGTLQADTFWTAGKFGYCLDFDGTGDYVLVSDSSSLELTQAIAVVAWINTSDNDKAIVSHYESNGNQRAWYIGAHSDGKIRALVSDNGSATTSHRKDYRGSVAFNDGDWHQIGFTYDGPSDTFNLYLDGDYDDNPTKDDDPSISEIHNSTGDLSIGSALSTGSPANEIDGQIDNVSIYNRVLSAAEIQSLYREPFQSFIKHRPELIANAGAAAPAGNPQVISIIISGLCVLGIPIVFIIGDRKAA